MHSAAVIGNVLSNFFLTFTRTLINSMKHEEQLKLEGVFYSGVKKEAQWFAREDDLETGCGGVGGTKTHNT